MRRALLLLASLSAVTALALWLARVGGSVEVEVGEIWVGITFPIAVMGLAILFALFHTILTAFHWVGELPARRRAARREQRRADGDAAVTRALVALAAGTPEAARVEVRRARMLLGETPQTLLLTAEAERLAGREDAAATVFKQLADRGDARFLGLRGLLRQAMQRQDWAAAQRLAKEAEAAQPGAAWLREERQVLALRTHDWREALALSPPDASRAALALAAAMQEEDPARAAEFEKQAFAADSAFAPAALAHARRLAATGSARRARAVLEQSWFAAPHPDVGAAWIAGEKDSLARVKAVEDLIHRNREHPESRLLMARTAIDAGLTGRARTELEALVGAGAADRRAYLMLAELEEVEHGDTADARAAQAKWLRAAANAQGAPRWRCASCGAEHNAWKAECAACGTVGRIGWSAAG
ncbi:heme biosynthesis HemY N-terminal domain-containing protein [Neoroseomonas soli]|uniref:Heme biosynthesis protein HemY n=1 Tax=Neoroseomonas soli TaxID=1081025 RepID=A0A9X9WQW4_9PROT|nr:heme biosynthesis HemY N-terminal domain-containing protein [Neoroseomonas soli]MBR0669543.1 heme biosynthesis protein HemY [Neoroseomonas soli]